MPGHRYDNFHSESDLKKKERERKQNINGLKKKEKKEKQDDSLHKKKSNKKTLELKSRKSIA